MTWNNNVYKTIWKNGIKEYNKKYICCFFTIWNLKNTITYKCGRVVVSCTSAYFAISKLIVLFSHSFHVPCIILLTFISTLYVPCFPFFLIDHNRNQVLLIKESSFFWRSKIYFCSFRLFKNGHIRNVVSTLINVVKLNDENNNIGLTLSNVVNINVEIDNIDLTL